MYLKVFPPTQMFYLVRNMILKSMKEDIKKSIKGKRKSVTLEVNIWEFIKLPQENLKIIKRVKILRILEKVERIQDKENLKLLKEKGIQEI